MRREGMDARSRPAQTGIQETGAAGVDDCRICQMPGRVNCLVVIPAKRECIV